ncbi:MAG: hypothetical protein AAGI23_16100 [Bacteroidota bacterium]
MVQEFYEKLTDGSLSTDEEAATYFFDSTPNNRNYKELKKRLHERLMNTLFFIDTQQAKYNERQKAYFNCWREYAAVKIMIVKGLYLNVETSLKKLLKLCQEYEFTELILEVLRSLRIHYGSKYPNFKLFEEYNNLFKIYEKVYLAENLSEEYSLSFYFLNYNANKVSESLISEKFKIYIDDLEPYIDNYDSYRLHLSYYMISLNGNMYFSRFDEVIATCKKAIQFFKQKSKYLQNPINYFSIQLILMHVQKKEFEQGEKLVTQLEGRLREGSFNWFSFYDYFFLLCMYTQRYRRAYDTFMDVFHHKKFSKTPTLIQERWQIYQAYIYYLIGLDKIKDIEPVKFRVNKFLNEVPNYSKNKRGENVPILIAQILFFILYKKYNKVIDRMEALEKYTYRHLKKDDTFRSNCFIKMLLIIPKANFHKAATERKAANLSKKLKSVPLEVAKQVYETEVIPYEDLWAIAIESLENKIWREKQLL